jgi:Glycosyl transferase family 2
MPERSIAVVIPTFNRVDLLPQTLDSVFAQTLKPTETIVVDDGSTDGTAAYLDALDVVQVRNSEGGWGPARARDEGLKRTSTELVAFIDSDDLMHPNGLEQLAAALEREPGAPFAFGRSLLATRDERGWHPAGLMTAEANELSEPLPALFARNFVPSAGTLVRVAAMARIGGYPTTVLFAEDHYLWLRLAQLGNPAFVPAITSVYRVHTGNRHTADRAGAELDRFAELAAEDPRLAAALPRRLGIHLCETATGALRAHSPRAVAIALRSGLGGRQQKRKIVRRAYDHWRARRRWHDAGLSAWDANAELRAWLDRF